MIFELEVVFPSNQDKYSNFRLTYNENQLETVGELKALVALRFYLSPNNFQLIYNQKHLTDDKQQLAGLLKPSAKRLYAVPILSVSPQSEAMRTAKENQVDPTNRRARYAQFKKWLEPNKQTKEYTEELEVLKQMLKQKNLPVKIKTIDMRYQLERNNGDIEESYNFLIRQ